MRALLAAMMMAVTALAGAAQAASGPREKILVSTTWLAANLADPNLVILQVGDKPAYDAGHIPGARLVNLGDISAAPSGPMSLTLEMLDAATLRDRLAALGISDTSKIVVYPTRDIQSATRVMFTLDAAGLGGRTVLLDGGLGTWKAEARALSTEVAAVKPGKLAALKMKSLVVDAAFVTAHVGTPGYVLVDARAPEFYSGAKAGGMPSKPHKAGHIAGAKSVPFASVTTQDLKLASAETVVAQFKAAGVKPGDTVVAYCHVGQQATAAIFAARSIGAKVLLYDGSFEEWSRLDGAVETSK